MEILSLNEPPEAPARKVSRAKAIGASMVVHLLLLLLFLRGLEGLPAPVAAWIRAHAARPPEMVAAVPVPSSADPATPQQKKKEEEAVKVPPIPLKFAYVKVPEEAQPQKNPNAPILSDRDRRARQEVPTPPDARQLTRDPHSRGDSRDRVQPDPRIKEGREQTEPPQPESHDAIAQDRLARDAEKAREQNGPAPRPAETPGEKEQDQAGSRTPDPRPDQSGPGARREAGASGSVTGRGQGPAGAPAGQAGSPAWNPRGGTEEKFRFDNPGWLRGETVEGTLSFDTKGLPWGDYARKIYVIIRQNWIDRLPLAYRQGQRGVTCQHFVIEKDGTISSVEVVKGSAVPPFDRAASDALRASSALPPLPPDFNLENEGVTGCFWYNLYPSDD